LIDRYAMSTKRQNQYTYDFTNEEALKNLNRSGKGGILISAHLGNWEIAGNLIYNRISSCVNIVAFDNEVKKIKSYLELRFASPRYKIIEIKNDLSHLIRIKQALDRNELVAIHADRVAKNAKPFMTNFFRKKANFPLGPFIIAHKFKTPISLVFAVKTGIHHYSLSATIIQSGKPPENLQRKYIEKLEEMVKLYPSQWYNFYKYYAD